MLRRHRKKEIGRNPVCRFLHQVKEEEFSHLTKICLYPSQTAVTYQWERRREGEAEGEKEEGRG